MAANFNVYSKYMYVDSYSYSTCVLQLISVAFEHSVLRVWEIYALENVVFCIAVYGPYKP